MSVESSTTLESVQETPSERVGSLGLPLLSGEEALCAGAEETLKINTRKEMTHSRCCFWSVRPDIHQRLYKYIRFVAITNFRGSTNFDIVMDKR